MPQAGRPAESDSAHAERVDPAWAPFVAGLVDYWRTGEDRIMMVRDDCGEVDPLPAGYLFADAAEGPGVERLALELCRGRVLDVGAGVGRHSLALQERGMAVTALEPHRETVAILRGRGVRDVRRGTLADFAAEHATSGEPGFDTVLLLMNGLGLAGTLGGLAPFLADAAAVLARGGQVLADSTDLRMGRGARRPDDRYIGELVLQVEYDGMRGDPFPYLFVDPETLAREATAAGWSIEVVGRGRAGAFVVRMERTGATP